MIASFSDTVSTFTVLVGMLRLGVIPFPISPRFSAPVIAHLLQKAGVSHVFLNDDSCLRALVKDAVAIATRGRSQIEVRDLPSYDAMYTDTWPSQLPERDYDRSSTAMFVHSSNSSSDFPKAVPWTILMQIQHARIPLKSREHSLAGQIFSCHSIELFHTLGLFFLFWTPASGLVIATFKPSSPAVLPSAENCFDGLRATRAAYALTHTRFLEVWATAHDKVEYLKGLKGLVSYAVWRKDFKTEHWGDASAAWGSALQLLWVAKSVRFLQVVFRSSSLFHDVDTELDDPGVDWDYFQRNPQCNIEFVDQGDGTFHALVIVGFNPSFVVEPTEDQAPNCTNTQWRGQSVFATEDLLIPHPTRKDYWKVLGRMDDQVMLSSGEVVNPVRYENLINSNPYVHSSLIFGRAKTHLGLLVELNDATRFIGPTAVEDVKNLIWPTLQRVNSISPSFCHISRNMIIFVTKDKPLVYNPKGSPKRANAFLQYQDEIDSLYMGTMDPFLERHPAQNRQTLSSAKIEHEVNVAPLIRAFNVNTDRDLVIGWSGYLGPVRSPAAEVFMSPASPPILV
ncbi:hypothetical protein VNI00_011084 [Paramarasmius palmivorus]|uniref:AMP-dependent synthetase/ligase domain-containing protein n=1 Tax=Paramarasmius palmivorus TaxID=297713 RepID=A0AAW0CHE6_9AGAR